MNNELKKISLQRAEIKQKKNSAFLILSLWLKLGVLASVREDGGE